MRKPPSRAAEHRKITPCVHNPVRCSKRKCSINGNSWWGKFRIREHFHFKPQTYFSQSSSSSGLPTKKVGFARGFFLKTINSSRRGLSGKKFPKLNTPAFYQPMISGVQWADRGIRSDIQLTRVTIAPPIRLSVPFNKKKKNPTSIDQVYI